MVMGYLENQPRKQTTPGRISTGAADFGTDPAWSRLLSEKSMMVCVRLRKVNLFR